MELHFDDEPGKPARLLPDGALVLLFGLFVALFLVFFATM